MELTFLGDLYLLYAENTLFDKLSNHVVCFSDKHCHCDFYIMNSQNYVFKELHLHP